MTSLTLYDGQQYDDDYKEEGDVKEESEHVSSCRFQDVGNAPARPEAMINVIHKTL